jgi:murein DD-endopeptidase MepM/ murein hydrolase activator NlpD
MPIAARLRTWLSAAASHAVRHDARWAGGLAAMAVTGALTGLLVDATAAVAPQRLKKQLASAVQTVGKPKPPRVLKWVGKDVDGDGAPDFVNPTGQGQRTSDAYGYGVFGAPRDGGSRPHLGVDFKATAGQAVKAPISGYVTKIGYAYAGDTNLKFVELSNPALHYKARVFYVNPKVDVGDAVHLGQTVGTAHTLQTKYPGGMTDHVHLEITNPAGRKIDAARVLTAYWAKGKAYTAEACSLNLGEPQGGSHAPAALPPDCRPLP